MQTCPELLQINLALAPRVLGWTMHLMLPGVFRPLLIIPIVMRSSEAMERKDLKSYSALSETFRRTWKHMNTNYLGQELQLLWTTGFNGLLQEKEPISAEIAKVEGLEASGSHTKHTIRPHEIDQCWQVNTCHSYLFWLLIARDAQGNEISWNRTWFVYSIDSFMHRPTRIQGDHYFFVKRNVLSSLIIDIVYFQIMLAEARISNGEAL